MVMFVKVRVIDLVETLVALVAVISPVRCMNQLVILIVAFLVETFSAVLAFPGSTIGSMISKVICSIESRV